MAPPTVLDPWLAGRHFGIVIDAGSSGSRMQIYSWKDPKSITIEKGSALAYSLPIVEKGTEKGDQWVKKVEPGLSSLADVITDDPDSVGAYLRPLLSHARDHVPPSLQKDTPLFLLATAGMRLLSSEKQVEILKETCRFLITHSHFKIDVSSPTGPCGSSVRIITGEEEGLFGWIAVNYLMNGFSGVSQDRTTYGFLDMGGASTQIAFEPSPEHQGDGKKLMDVRLRLLGGEEIHHKVFVTTWLGYGTNQARERYVESLIKANGGKVANEERITDPCLPKGLTLQEPLLDGEKTYQLAGTGSFEECMKKTSSLLNKNAPCPDTPCLMNGVHVPPIDFSVSHFIGISEYWYSSEHIFGLGGAYDFVQYERAAVQFCSRDWDGILKEHDDSRAKHQLGGDGEIEKDGKIVEAGVWGPEVEVPRLQMQCFKAAWITNVLHDGISMPRIVDPGGNITTESDKVVEEAERKGLGKPTFQSVDTVGDIAISWTLGKMVLEASKEVVPLKSARPIVDPIDDLENTSNPPFEPIRPPYMLDVIEDTITPHLPDSLTRSSLGFSPVLFFFYIMLVFVIILVAFPKRRQLRSFCLRSLRSVVRRDAYGDLGMEEGKLKQRPPSPTSSSKHWLYPIRRALSFPRVSPLPKMATLNSSNFIISSPRSSPTRSTSMTNGFSETTASSSQYMSRPSSPALDYDDGPAIAGRQTTLSSRSRNNSYINLSNMVSRPTAISRVNSAYGKGNLQDY